MHRRVTTSVSYIAAIVGVILAGTTAVSAFSASSTNYKLDDADINSFGGSASSTNYRLTDSGGEPFIGPGSSTTYKVNAGYVASLEHSISLTLDAASVTIPQVSPGTSKTATSQATVFTDAAGYLLSAAEDHDLLHTDTVTTISAVASSIASPAAWTEGTTKGLGFTLTAGSSLESKWTTPVAYAAFPTTATTIHAKPSYQNTNDVTTIQYRLDVPTTQKVGSYSNNITYTAVVSP